ncbi:MAG: hypothetical protein Q9174_003209 [Haloplaca sp. 1 TL-2023]
MLERQVVCIQPKSQFDVAWRNQNAVASSAVQRRVKASGKAAREEEGIVDIRPSREGSVPLVLPQDFSHYAVSFFFNSYVMMPALGISGSRGFLEYLYPVWLQSSENSPLRPATTSVALCLLEAWSFLDPNSPQSMARSYYAQGVSALRKRLQSTEDIDDDVIMATLMLHMYDGVTSFCAGRPHEGLHIKGSKAMIESRRRRPMKDDTSRKVLLAARGLFVGKALTAKESVSVDMLDWKTTSNEVPRSPAFDLDDIQVEVANLHASISNMMSDPETDDAIVLHTLATANELDQRLVDWRETMPEDWNPIYIQDAELIPKTVRDAGCYQGRCAIHKSVFIANMLNGHCCSRIKLQQVILACLDRLDDPFYDRTRATACDKVQNLADAICATVPYFLGDRLGVRRIDDKSVQYPHLGFNPVPSDHYEPAAAYAGIFLTQRLVELLPPGVPMRNGQRQWILGQIQRVRRVYLASPRS